MAESVERMSRERVLRLSHAVFKACEEALIRESVIVAHGSLGSWEPRFRMVMLDSGGVEMEFEVVAGADVGELVWEAVKVTVDPQVLG